MKKSILFIFAVLCMSFANWQSNFETAKKIAKEKNILIMLNFSGSDWCGPCMRMRKEIFDSKVFSAMASESLVMVNADFPRNKKNQLEKSTVKENEQLADRYNPDGHFPFTVLLDGEGNLLKSWDGLPKVNAEEFSKQVKSFIDGHK